MSRRKFVFMLMALTFFVSCKPAASDRDYPAAPVNTEIVTPAPTANISTPSPSPVPMPTATPVPTPIPELCTPTPPEYFPKAVEAAIDLGFVPKHLQGNTDEPITRLEFVELAVRLIELSTDRTAAETAMLFLTGVQYPNIYQDTNSKYAQAAYYLYIYRGIDDFNPAYEQGFFKPDDSITRQEMALMLYHTAAVEGKQYHPAVNDYADQSSIDILAASATAFVKGRSLMSGDGTNRFDPMGIVTRNQAIAALFELYNTPSTIPEQAGLSQFSKTEEDIVIEKDRYILTIPAGVLYRSDFIDCLDMSFDTVEQLTGFTFMSGNFKTKKVQISLVNDGHDAVLDDSQVWFSVNTAVLPPPAMNTLCHELTHIIFFRNFNDSGLSRMIVEGYAEFIGNMCGEQLAFDSFSSGYNLELYTELEEIILEGMSVNLNDSLTAINTEGLLDQSFIDAYRQGFLLFSFMYDRYGMDAIHNFISKLETHTGKDKVAILASCIEVDDPARAFLIWYAEHRGEVVCITGSEQNFRKRNANMSETHYYSPTITQYVTVYDHLVFDVSKSDAVINLAEGIAYAKYKGFDLRPYAIYLQSDVPITAEFYDQNGRLLSTCTTVSPTNGAFGFNYSSGQLWSEIPEVEYMVVIGNGIVDLHFGYLG